jgi:hypothetical protein
MPTLNAFFDLLGSLISFTGFLVAGFALGRFTLDAYRKGVWQVQAALAMGFFALLAALTNYASSGLAGAFALGAGLAFLMDYSPKKDAGDKG